MGQAPKERVPHRIAAAIAGLVCVFLSAVPGAPAEPADRGFPYLWTQYGPGGSRIARLVLAEGNPCPAVTTDAGTIPMNQRIPADRAAFPVTVCSAILPDAAGPASVLGRPLPPLPADAGRIALIGDTGCRIAKNWVQDCNDPGTPSLTGGWPFHRLASLMATTEKDLILHLGDFHYREAPCPPGNAACAGSVSGDNWQSWKQDWFDPVRPILGQKPWVFVRGNHENCARAPQGWFLFMGHGPPDEAARPCDGYTEGYLTTVGESLELAVLDSSQVRSKVRDPDACDAWVRQASALLDRPVPPGRRRWVLTHAPVYYWYSEGDNAALVPAPCNGEKFDPSGYLRWYAAGKIGRGDPVGYQAVLSGHLHMWQWAKARDRRLPVQITVGNSGTELSTLAYWPPLQAWPEGNQEDRAPFTGGGWWNTEVVFGFAVIERLSGDASRWHIGMTDLAGRLRLICALGDGAAAIIAERDALDPAAAAELGRAGCVRPD